MTEQVSMIERKQMIEAKIRDYNEIKYVIKLLKEKPQPFKGPQYERILENLSKEGEFLQTATLSLKYTLLDKEIEQLNEEFKKLPPYEKTQIVKGGSLKKTKKRYKK